MGINEKPMLINSENLEKIRTLFSDTAGFIKQAIKENRHILIKHHDDTDGYISGFVIEKAILPLIESSKKHFFITRNVSKAPFYDYSDALRDINTHGYDQKPPVLILTDLGSNDQSIRSINRCKDYGFDIIIVDHHKYNDENKDTAKFYISSQIIGLNSSISAGALATELALFINPELKGITHLPALAGSGDKSTGKEHEEYVRLSGYDEDFLKKWSFVIEHETYYLRFFGRTEFIEDLFSKQLNAGFVEERYKLIDRDLEKVRIAAKKFVMVKQYPKFKFLSLRKDLISSWDFASSKLTRFTHELETGPRITFVMTPETLSYRADDVSFTGLDLLEKLKERFPYAMITGGGHDFAGAIYFNQASREEIMNYINSYIEKL